MIDQAVTLGASAGAWMIAMAFFTCLLAFVLYTKGLGQVEPSQTSKIVLTTIHKISTPVIAKMDAKLPANFAIASAALCPSVYFSVVGFLEILLSASRFSTSSYVISCLISSHLSAQHAPRRIPVAIINLKYVSCGMLPFSDA